MTIIAAGSVIKSRMAYYSAAVFLLLLALATLCLSIPFPGDSWRLAAHAIGIGLTAGLLSRLGRSAARSVVSHLGERAALRELESLPNDFAAITNWTAPGVRHGDVDLLVLGPPGVLLMTIKKAKRPLACQEDHWFRVRKDGSKVRIRSLSWEAKRNATAVSSYLRSRGMRVTVRPILVFDGDAEVHLDNPTVPVIRRSEMLDYVKSLPTNEPVTAELLRAA